jgi:hypothetical protein
MDYCTHMNLIPRPSRRIGNYSDFRASVPQIITFSFRNHRIVSRLLVDELIDTLHQMKFS